ncbi:MAG: argininosuccinate lyase [Thermoanaerobaculia bacterium]
MKKGLAASPGAGSGRAKAGPLQARSLWGGRFTQPPADVLKRFNDSFAFDKALLAQDVTGSIAWAAALGDAGALNATEVRKLQKALRAIPLDVLPETGTHEDVHSYVEATLAQSLGPLAGKLHTGRSRNDQVATDLRLYLKAALREAGDLTLGLADTLATRAEKEAGTAMPGYTHLKRAEPITFGHWALSYVEMLLRDADRFAAALGRADECPLGSGALAGTPVPIDRPALARALGFARATRNSLDGVSDRDALAEYLFGGSLLLVHLSRLAEDLIVYSSDEFAFVELPDALATGSSRMPQKKNPDVLELVRGHAGRAIGDLTGLLAILKGLPLAYDKDLQLDKEPAFRLRATLATALPALDALMAGLKLDRARMEREASDDRLLATGLADALAARGVPFRQAHDIVGKRVAAATQAGKSLAALGPDAEVTVDDLKSLHVGRALSLRTVLGGTAPAKVRKAARAALRRITAARKGTA